MIDLNGKTSKRLGSDGLKKGVKRTSYHNEGKGKRKGFKNCKGNMGFPFGWCREKNMAFVHIFQTE